MRSIAWAVVLVLLMIQSPWADDQSGDGGPPPLPWAGEKFKPPEVTDREKSTDPYPWVICSKQRQDGTIEYQAIYADGFEVKYVPGVSFIVRTPTDYGPKRVLYDLAKRGAPTVLEAPTPPAHKTTPGRTPIVGDLPLSPGKTPIVPAKPTPKTPTKTPGRTTTVEPPPTPGTGDTPPTTTITFIIKAGATVGGPGDDSIVQFENPPPITPEDFVAEYQTKTAVVGFSWDGGDKEGPIYQSFDGQPPDGQPPDKTYSFGITSITTLFGLNMFVNVGWGWTHATIPAEMVFACINEDDAAALERLAKAAEQGGPEYWRQRAASLRAQAARDKGLRPKAAVVAQRQADEAEDTAAKLDERGVPDKPDPKLPKDKRDQIEKQRKAAVEKIKAEAEEARTK
jgi:hypothetical protein